MSEQKPFQTEEEMRTETVPTLDTLDELKGYIDSLVERQHDYGTCVYATSMAATAAFRLVARKLGITGFQASCADLDILRRTRRMEGPFIIINGEDALYLQYDLPGRLAEALEEWRPWLAVEAKKKLEDPGSGLANPRVLAHWKMLARG